jgi:hypothetical protein
MLKAIPFPSVAIIMGDKGSGKSGVAHARAEMEHKKTGRLAVLHLPTASKNVQKDIRKLIPPWMTITTRRQEWPNDCTVLYDEASQSAHARRSQTGEALELDNLIGISRQRNQLILFISHHSRKLDKNAVTDSGLVLWKRPTYAHVLFEREELHDFVMKAFDFFQAIKNEKQQKRTTLCMDFRTFHFTTFTNDLATYWSHELSCLFERIKNTKTAGSLFKGE